MRVLHYMATIELEGRAANSKNTCAICQCSGTGGSPVSSCDGVDIAELVTRRKEVFIRGNFSRIAGKPFWNPQLPASNIT